MKVRSEEDFYTLRHKIEAAYVMAFQKFLQPQICTLTFIIFLVLLFNCLDSADRKEDIKRQ